MQGRVMRRHQTDRHMRRRLQEDRNQHYNNLTCSCWSDPKAMARFKEQPNDAAGHGAAAIRVVSAASAQCRNYVPAWSR
jgi:hypothetical protein